MGRDEDSEYGLVMPFVVCQSRGGPYDDAAFVAGWAMAQFDADVSRRDFSSGYEYPSMIRAICKPQADLIAMRYGCRCEFGDPVDGWVSVTLTT